MPIEKKEILHFVEYANTLPVLDVRSPAEFEHAHIPGAFSFPIFSNEERKEIGTIYKQVSREQAIKIGLDYFGKKMVALVERAEKIIAESGKTSKTVAVHCWRGGMRSAAIAWLLDLYGFKVYLLTGGYKAYRNWTLTLFEKPYQLNIVSGYTGSNKTGIIVELQKIGIPALDLEGLAAHKGSAFGSIGMTTQPGQEMFENLLAMELFRLQNEYPGKAIWIEDESQRIGNINIPSAFFKKMREQVILFMEVDFELRLQFICETYGIHEKEKLMHATQRIQKKLGGLESREVLQFLDEGNTKAAFEILLRYYDRLYLKSSHKRKNSEQSIQKIKLATTDPIKNTSLLLTHVGN